MSESTFSSLVNVITPGTKFKQFQPDLELLADPNYDGILHIPQRVALFFLESQFEDEFKSPFTDPLPSPEPEFLEFYDQIDPVPFSRAWEVRLPAETYDHQVSLAEVIEEFLEFLSRERSPHTYEWYRYRLKRLHERYPSIRAGDLRPIDVRKWVDAYELSQTSRHNYFRTIKTCFKWAQREGLIRENPLAHLSVPTAESKDVYVPLAEFERLLSLAGHDAQAREEAR